MAHKKPWMGYEEQLELLIKRGMRVTDREKALEYLQRIGYYRLSGYWYAFRQRHGKNCVPGKDGQRVNNKKSGKPLESTIALDEFKEGTTFKNVVDLYVFDKQLRLLAMDALERIEIALRADISHTLGKIDPFAYLNPELFHKTFSVTLDERTGLTKHHQWLGRHAQLITRSREEFVSHHRDRYGYPLAIWVACELWDFGTMSTLFGGLREQEQNAIAQRYGIDNGRTFASWLRSMNYLRNVCAHHARLWNRNVIDQPKLPAVHEVDWVKEVEEDRHARARCFVLLLIVRHVLQVINPRSKWSERMKSHLKGFGRLELDHLGLNLRGMGAPDGWENIW